MVRRACQSILACSSTFFRDFLAEGVAARPEHFARAPVAVLARFADHLGRDLTTALTTLAHARRFDERLLAHLKAHPGLHLGPLGLREVTRYSLVEADQDGFFRLHQHFQDLQRQALARTRPDDQRRIDAALLAWWELCCQPPDLRSLDAAHETALRVAAHHQRLLAPEVHVAWLAARWPPFRQDARLQLGLELWETVLATVEHANGSDSAATATALGNLGIVLRMQGDLPRARAVEERTLLIFERQLPATHPQIAQACENLAITLERLGEAGRAGALRVRAAAIRGGEAG